MSNFHSAKSGYKIDSLLAQNKASFCVIDTDRVIAEKMADKYSFGFEELKKKEIQKLFHVVTVLKLEIEQMSGKASLDLLQK